MLNNIFDKKNIEYSLKSKNTLPYDSEDVSLKKDQIIFTSINNIFQKLVDNDLYNDQLIQNIKINDAIPGPTITDNINVVYNAQIGKKFVLTGDDGSVQIAHKLLCKPDEALSGPQIPDKNVNFLVLYNGFYVAGTTEGIWQVPDKYSNMWERPSGEGFLSAFEGYNTICFALNNFRGEFNNKFDDYDAFLGTDHGIYAYDIEGWTRIVPELSNDTVVKIFPSISDKSIFISTLSSLYTYDGNKLKMELGVYNCKTNDLAELDKVSKENKYLIATDNGIKQSQSVLTFENIKLEKSLSSRIIDITGDSQVRFIGTSSGLYKYPSFEEIPELKNKYIFDTSYFEGNAYSIVDGCLYVINYDKNSCNKIQAVNVKPYENINNKELKFVDVFDSVVVVATENSLYYSRIFDDDRNLKLWKKVEDITNNSEIYEIKFNNNKLYVRTSKGVRVYEVDTAFNTFDLVFTNILSSYNIKFAKNIDDEVYICAANSKRFNNDAISTCYVSDEKALYAGNLPNILENRIVTSERIDLVADDKQKAVKDTIDNNSKIFSGSNLFFTNDQISNISARDKLIKSIKLHIRLYYKCWGNPKYEKNPELSITCLNRNDINIVNSIEYCESNVILPGSNYRISLDKKSITFTAPTNNGDKDAPDPAIESSIIVYFNSDINVNDIYVHFTSKDSLTDPDHGFPLIRFSIWGEEYTITDSLNYNLYKYLNNYDVQKIYNDINVIDMISYHDNTYLATDEGLRVIDCIPNEINISNKLNIISSVISIAVEHDDEYNFDYDVPIIGALLSDDSSIKNLEYLTINNEFKQDEFADYLIINFSDHVSYVDLYSSSLSLVNIMETKNTTSLQKFNDVVYGVISSKDENSVYRLIAEFQKTVELYSDNLKYFKDIKLIKDQYPPETILANPYILSVLDESENLSTIDVGIDIPKSYYSKYLDSYNVYTLSSKALIGKTLDDISCVNSITKNSNFITIIYNKRNKIIEDGEEYEELSTDDAYDIDGNLSDSNDDTYICGINGKDLDKGIIYAISYNENLIKTNINKSFNENVNDIDFIPYATEINTNRHAIMALDDNDFNAYILSTKNIDVIPIYDDSFIATNNNINEPFNINHELYPVSVNTNLKNNKFNSIDNLYFYDPTYKEVVDGINFVGTNSGLYTSRLKNKLSVIPEACDIFVPDPNETPGYWFNYEVKPDDTIKITNVNKFHEIFKKERIPELNTKSHDVLIWVDSSGSMVEEIESIKSSIENLLDALNSNKSLDVIAENRIAIAVGLSDKIKTYLKTSTAKGGAGLSLPDNGTYIRPDEQALYITRFTTNKDEFSKAVNLLNTSFGKKLSNGTREYQAPRLKRNSNDNSGKDISEDPTVIVRAFDKDTSNNFELNWNSNAEKIIIFISDETSHIDKIIDPSSNNHNTGPCDEMFGIDDKWPIGIYSNNFINALNENVDKVFFIYSDISENKPPAVLSAYEKINNEFNNRLNTEKIIYNSLNCSAEETADKIIEIFNTYLTNTIKYYYSEPEGKTVLYNETDDLSSKIPEFRFVIPYKIDGYYVSEIADGAFKNNVAFKHFVTQKYMNNIGNDIFDIKCDDMSLLEIYNKTCLEDNSLSSLSSLIIKNKLTVNFHNNGGDSISLNATGINIFDDKTYIPSIRGIYSFNPEQEKTRFELIQNNLSRSCINRLLKYDNNYLALLGKNDEFIVSAGGILSDFTNENIIYDNNKNILSNAECKDVIVLDNAMSTIILSTDIIKTINVMLNYNNSEVEADISSINNLCNHLLIGTASYGKWIKFNSDENTWYPITDFTYICASSAKDFGELSQIKENGGIDPEYIDSILTALVLNSDVDDYIKYICNSYNENNDNDTSISSSIIVYKVNLENIKDSINLYKKNLIEIEDTLSISYGYRNPNPLYDRITSAFSNAYIGNLTADNLNDSSSYSINLFSFNPHVTYESNEDDDIDIDIDKIKIVNSSTYDMTYTYDLTNVKNVKATWFVSNNILEDRLHLLDRSYDFNNMSSCTDDLDENHNTINNSLFYSVMSGLTKDIDYDIVLSLSYEIKDDLLPAKIIINDIDVEIESDTYIINEEYEQNDETNGILYNKTNEFTDLNIYSGSISAVNLAYDGLYNIELLNSKIRNIKNKVTGHQSVRLELDYNIDLIPILENVKNVKLNVITKNDIYDTIIGEKNIYGEIIKSIDINNNEAINIDTKYICDKPLADQFANIVLKLTYEVINENLPANIYLTDISVRSSCISYLIKYINIGTGGIRYLHSTSLSSGICNTGNDINLDFIDLSKDKSINGVYAHEDSLITVNNADVLKTIYKDIDDDQDARVSANYKIDIIPEFYGMSDVKLTLYSIENIFEDLTYEYENEIVSCTIDLTNNNISKFNIISIIDTYVNDHKNDKILYKLTYKKVSDPKFRFKSIDINYDVITDLIDMLYLPSVKSTNDILYFCDVPQFQNHYITKQNDMFWSLDLNKVLGRLINELNLHTISTKKINLGRTIYSFIPTTNKNEFYNELIYFYKGELENEGLLRAVPFTNKSLNVNDAILSSTTNGNVNCITETGDLIVVGTNSGVYYSRKATGHQYLYRKVKLSNSSSNITTVKYINNLVYCGTDNGLYILNHNSNNLFEAAYVLAGYKILSIFDNESRYDDILYVSVITDKNEYLTFECKGTLINNEVLFCDEIPLMGALYENKLYEKDIVLALNSFNNFIYTRNKYYDLEAYVKQDNDFSNDIINDIRTSIDGEEESEYNLNHFILVSTNNGLYLKSYLIDSWDAISPNNPTIGWHKIDLSKNKYIKNTLHKDSYNVKSSVIKDNEIFMLIDNVMFINKKPLNLVKLCNDALDRANNGQADLSQIEDNKYYICDLSKLDLVGIKFIVYERAVYLLTNKGIFNIISFSVIAVDPDLDSSNVKNASSLGIYNYNGENKLFIGTQCNSLYELSNDIFIKHPKTGGIFFDNIKFEENTCYAIENSRTDVMNVIEEEPWKFINYNDFNTQFINLSSNIILGTSCGLYRRSLTDKITYKTTYEPKHDIESMEIYNDELFASFEIRHILGSDVILKSYGTLGLSTVFDSTIAKMGVLKNKLLISLLNEIKAYSILMGYRDTYTDIINHLCNVDEFVVGSFCDTAGKAYFSVNEHLLSFDDLMPARAFLDGIKSYYYLSKTFNKNVNRIYKISDTSFLIGWHKGLRYVIDNSLSRKYINRNYPDLSLSGNVTVIEDSVDVDDNKKYLIAQNDKLFATTDLLNVDYEIKSIPFKTTIIQDLLVESLNTYGIATNQGVYFTSIKYKLEDDLTKYTIDSVKQDMAEYIKNRLYVGSNSHLSTYHNEDSIITKLNNKLDCNFSTFPSNFYTDQYYKLANGVEYVENDVIENIEFNEGRGYIKASIRNPVVDAIGGKSNYSSPAFVDEFTDPIDGSIVDMFNIEYIVKIWQSGLKEFYIYLPSTATYYMNNPFGFTPCRFATAYYNRKNIPAVPPFVNKTSEVATRIRLYINNSHFKLTELQQIEITGNSLPLKIYKDAEHCIKGRENMFDTVIQPSIVKTLPIANGNNVNNIKNMVDDQHRLVIEFCAYGTDAQAIKIFGR